MSFFHTIKFRFTVWYLLVLIVLLGVLSTSVYLYLSRSLYANLDRSLELRTEQLQGVPQIVDSIRQGQFQEELGEIVVLCLYSGDEIMALSSRHLTFVMDEAVIEQAMAGRTSFLTVDAGEGGTVRLCATPLDQSGPRLGPAAVIVGRSTAEIEHALARLVATLAIAVPVTLLVAAWGGFFLAHQALKPVDRITGTARAISESDLSQRIEVTTRDELGRLGDTLNQMIDRLQKAFKRQQQFTGDASHELRAPLAVVQAEASLALQKERTAGEYRKSLELISAEAGHMASMIDRLLLLARADAGQEKLVFRKLSIDALLRDAGRDAEVLNREKGITFIMGEVQQAEVEGDESLLRQLFMNLFENAVRYTPSGSIKASLHNAGGMAVVTVEDTGIGIPQEDLPMIFERFYRVDKARSRADGGSGLGLAIGRYIVEVHGGRIEAASRLGEGSTFTVRLPLAD